MNDPVNHPPHYGGAANPYEAIKVIEAWDLGFCLGNTLKYISRAGKKGDTLEDLRKAQWYLNREIQRLAGQTVPHMSQESAAAKPVRLSRVSPRRGRRLAKKG